MAAKCPRSGSSSTAIPGFTAGGLLGGWLTWIKAISLLCLVGWVGAWLVTAIKERYLARGGWLDLRGPRGPLPDPDHDADPDAAGRQAGS